MRTCFRLLSAFAAIALVTAVPHALAQSVSNGTPDFQEPGAPPAGTDRVAFYGYVFDSTLDDPMPANTQYPWGVADWGSYIITGEAPCGLPAQPACDPYWANKVALFSTAGPVQIKSTQEFDYGKLHNEHGLTQEVLFDTTQDVTATIHVSTAAHGWPHNENETPCIAQDPPQNIPCLQTYWRWHSGASPLFQIRAWLYGMVLGEHGADASTAPPVRSIFESNAGMLIAQGESTPMTMVSLDGNGGNQRVWRFDLNLGKPQVETLSREHNLVLVYSFHNKMPDGSEVDPGNLRINTGEFFPTSFTVPVKNAFTVELVAPQIIHDKLVTIGVMNTPWGSYDLNPKSVRLTMTDADGREVDMPGLKQVADFSVAHGAHYKPINVSFVWDHLAHKLPAGAYKITLSASNFQGSARDELSAFLEIGPTGKLLRVEPGRAGVSTFSDIDFGKFVGGAARAAKAPANGTSDGGRDGPRLAPVLDTVSPAGINGDGNALSPYYALPGANALFALLLAGIAALVTRRRSS